MFDSNQVRNALNQASYMEKHMKQNILAISKTFKVNDKQFICLKCEQNKKACSNVFQSKGKLICYNCGNIVEKHMRENNNTFLKSSQKQEQLDPKSSKEGKLKVCSPALHPEFIYPLIDVAEMSIEKGYRPLNWLDKDNKVTAMYLIEAAQRHLDKLKLGIDINTEEKKLDGTPTNTKPTHWAAVAFNMLMADLQQRKGVFIDDRLFKDGEIK